MIAGLEKGQRMNRTGIKRRLLVLFWVTFLAVACGGSGDDGGDNGSCVDNDGDGYGANCDLGQDCNDSSAAVHPGAMEFCDGIDNNCDGQTDEQVEVYFPDSNLKTAIISELGLSGDTVYNTAFCQLTSLDLRNKGISSLSGIEYAWALNLLLLDGNPLTDISSLATLAGMGFLSLGNTGIYDLSPLSGLTNMEFLYLNNNNLTDLSGLSAMKSLNTIDVSYNPALSDLSLLSGLHSLQSIFVQYDNIGSIKPLWDNASLGPGDQVELHHNPLDSLSCCTYIPDLKDRGATFLNDDGYCSATYAC